VKGAAVLGDAISALGERRFLYLFLARSTSFLGDNIAPVALAFAVLELSDSASDLGLVLAARTLPLVLLTLAGGVWADRLPRQVLMYTSDFVRCGTQGSLAVLLLSGRARIWELIVLQLLNGSATALFRPASTGLTPQTVSAARLHHANALLTISFNSAAVAGPAVGGALVVAGGAGTAIAVDAATFLVSALFLSRIKLPSVAVPVGDRDFFREFREGWHELRARSWLSLSIVDFALFQLIVLSTVFVLGPLVSQRLLGGVTAWAAIVTAWGAGGIVGGFIVLGYRPRRPLVSAYLVAALVSPLMFLLGVAAPIATIVVAAVIAGGAIGVAGTIWPTVLQQRVPASALSRVSAYDWMGSTALRPIGYALVGPLAVAVGIRTTLIGAAAATLFLQLAAAASPSIRRVRADAADEEAPTNLITEPVDHAPAT
jgi:MFS family permease